MSKNKTHEHCTHDVNHINGRLIEEPCEFCGTQPYHYMLAPDSNTRTACCWARVPE